MKKSLSKFFGWLALALITCLVASSFIVAPSETLTVLAPVAAIAGAVFILANISRLSRRTSLIAATNTLPANLGTSKNRRRYRASAAMTTRNLFVKMGADDEHIAAVAATADKPIGVAIDEAAAAEDPVTVELLGVTNRTLVCVAGAAITVGADVYTTSAGKVTVKPTAAGTYWRVGVALTAPGADGDPVEVATCKPRKLIVVAALTQTSSSTLGAVTIGGTYSQAEVQALRAEAGKLQADFYVLSAALSGDADVTVATT